MNNVWFHITNNRCFVVGRRGWIISMGLLDSFFVFTNLCVHDFAFGDDIACGLGAMV